MNARKILKVCESTDLLTYEEANELLISYFTKKMKSIGAIFPGINHFYCRYFVGRGNDYDTLCKKARNYGKILSKKIKNATVVPGVGDHSFYLDVEDFVSSSLLVISIDCQVNSNSSISSSSQFFTVEMTIVLRNSLDLHKKKQRTY